MLETFTIETFTPLVNDPFQVVYAVPPIQLQLVSVTEVGGGGPLDPLAGLRRTPFSLIFRGPPTPLLLQQSCRIEHATLGAFDLFIVPLGPDGEGQQYEAIFT